MIKFRKKTGKEVYEDIKGASKVILPVSATAFGAANLSLNMSRKKQDTELRREQTKALEDLTKALKEQNESKEIKRSASKTRAAFKKKHIEDLDEDDIIVLPNPVSKLKKLTKRNDRV